MPGTKIAAAPCHYPADHIIGGVTDVGTFYCNVCNTVSSLCLPPNVDLWPKLYTRIYRIQMIDFAHARDTLDSKLRQESANERKLYCY